MNDLYQLDLTDDEYRLLTEVVDDKKIYFEKLLTHAIGDDRKWALKMLPMLEAIAQELDDARKEVKNQ